MELEHLSVLQKSHFQSNPEIYTTLIPEIYKTLNPEIYKTLNPESIQK